MPVPPWHAAAISPELPQKTSPGPGAALPARLLQLAFLTDNAQRTCLRLVAAAHCQHMAHLHTHGSPEDAFLLVWPRATQPGPAARLLVDQTGGFHSKKRSHLAPACSITNCTSHEMRCRKPPAGLFFGFYQQTDATNILYTNLLNNLHQAAQ